MKIKVEVVGERKCLSCDGRVIGAGDSKGVGSRLQTGFLCKDCAAALNPLLALQERRLVPAGGHHE